MKSEEENKVKMRSPKVNDTVTKERSQTKKRKTHCNNGHWTEMEM